MKKPVGYGLNSFRSQVQVGCAVAINTVCMHTHMRYLIHYLCQWIFVVVSVAHSRLFIAQAETKTAASKTKTKKFIV